VSPGDVARRTFADQTAHCDSNRVEKATGPSEFLDAQYRSQARHDPGVATPTASQARQRSMNSRTIADCSSGEIRGDPGEGCFGIGGGSDGTADDEVIGAEFDGF